ncbi:unnamed protein product [Hydatigera taeniaeformis]|uniref:C2 domain-containing protein n=1 Tax=Hydatigena taeniaeformis TaxID=6205 RepID=A0A0R3WM78_HYDTA|nr:unnamed protein product [Hydatigera taeniaeformis]
MWFLRLRFWAVKEARLQGFNNSVAVLVALDVNGAKSFTRTLTGCNPIWNEEFSYELDNVEGGILLEVQLKGFLRRRTIGAFYVPIKKVRQGVAASRHPSWVALGAEVKLRNGKIVGTQGPTKNFLFLDIWLTFDKGVPTTPRIANAYENGDVGKIDEYAGFYVRM